MEARSSRLCKRAMHEHAISRCERDRRWKAKLQATPASRPTNDASGSPSEPTSGAGFRCRRRRPLPRRASMRTAGNRLKSRALCHSRSSSTRKRPAGADNAGDVDDDVDAPPSSKDRIDDRLAARRGGYVCRDELFRRKAARTGSRSGGAGFEQARNDGLADALGTTGHRMTAGTSDRGDRGRTDGAEPVGEFRTRRLATPRAAARTHAPPSPPPPAPRRRGRPTAGPTMSTRRGPRHSRRYRSPPR